jgi:beta-lactamase class D
LARRFGWAAAASLLCGALLQEPAVARAEQGRPIPDPKAAALADVFAGVDAAFVVRDEQSGSVTRHNPARAATPFPPMSTFKIPNMLIGLETGVLTGPDHEMAWDPARVPGWENWDAGFKETWAKDQTLRSAFAVSAVWYFQEVARQIGPQRMQTFLDRFDYGNRDISGGIDHFWLESSLLISADQQVDFLRRFRHGELGLAPATTATAADIMIRERGDGWVWSAKTGSGVRAPGIWIVWLVGYVERDGNVWFFAMNLDGKTYAEARDRRTALARRALEVVGALPPAP